MASAICFDLDQSKILLSGNALTLPNNKISVQSQLTIYYTIPTFNDLGKKKPF